MTRKEEIEHAAFDYLCGDKSYASSLESKGFVKGAEWADKTMIDKVCDFIRLNAYKYRQLKFVKNKATFDFRTYRLIEDLRKAMEE